MEEKNKSNKGLVIAVVVLAIALVGTVGYIGYDKVFSTTEDSNLVESSNTNTGTTEDIDEEVSSSTKSKVSVTPFQFRSVAIVSDGSVYVNVYGTTSDIDDLFGDGTFQTLVATRNNYQEYTFNNFEYNTGGDKFVGMKLNVSNVKKVYGYEVGQAMSPNYGLILLNEDKTLSIISLYSLVTGKTEVTNIPNLSDVETIISENHGGVVMYAVKTNGEKVNMDDYVPKDYTQF